MQPDNDSLTCIKSSCRHIGLEANHKPIPDKMLQLMPILEAEGREFAEKQLISIPGCFTTTFCPPGLSECLSHQICVSVQTAKTKR